MFNIECVIQDKGNISFIYKSNIIPKRKETVISRDDVYKVNGVIHYTYKPNHVSLLVETIKHR